MDVTLSFSEFDIFFKKEDIGGLSSSKPRQKFKLDWYMGQSELNRLKKIVNTLVLKYPKLSAKKAWELLREDSELEGELDPDCLIIEIGAE
ncbi:MAG: hypothetical protein HWE07_00380 [Cytophagia bacterium]|nr:hypothetical protein [Cytophagia bacterium]